MRFSFWDVTERAKATSCSLLSVLPYGIAVEVRERERRFSMFLWSALNDISRIKHHPIGSIKKKLQQFANFKGVLRRCLFQNVCSCFLSSWIIFIGLRRNMG
jgi:hypothetical protein